MAVFIGIDGGGTDTRFRAIDETGSVMLSGTLLHDGCKISMNPLGGGDPALCARLLKNEVQCSGEVLGIAAGCAGSGDASVRERIRGAVAEAGFSCDIAILGDEEMLFRAAFPDGDGIMLEAGTGSVCTGRKGNTSARSGGLGHVFDDAGSAYYIAREMLASAARAYDGRGGSMRLMAAVCSFCGADNGDMERVAAYCCSQERRKSEIAALARQLGPHIAAGDAEAACIADSAAECLYGMLKAVKERLSMSHVRAALCGGVLEQEYAGSVRSRVISLIRSRMPDAEILSGPFDPALAAALYARKKYNSVYKKI